jgi:cold shock CspA family protein
MRGRLFWKGTFGFVYPENGGRNPFLAGADLAYVGAATGDLVEVDVTEEDRGPRARNARIIERLAPGQVFIPPRRRKRGERGGPSKARRAERRAVEAPSPAETLAKAWGVQ